MPLHGNYLGKYVPFDPRTIWRTPWEKAGLPYDMYALHGIWNGSAVRALMNRQKVDPRGRGFYFTIVRDRGFTQLYILVVEFCLNFRQLLSYNSCTKCTHLPS